MKDLSPVYDLIRADGSIVLNKNLCHAIGINETIMYSELLSRYNYFSIREELDEEGYFFNTVNNFQLGTCLGEKPQKTAIDNLIKLGLIQYKLKGVPPKRYFKICDNIQTLFDLLVKGKENIKLLERKQAERTEKSKLRLLGGIESAKREELNPPNGCANNTNSNNTKSIILNIEGSEPPEVWEGTPTGDSHSIPFPDFLLQDIKRYKTEHRREIVELIIYYYGQYYEKFGKEHYRYKTETLKDVYSKLDEVMSIGITDPEYDRILCVDVDAMKSIIDRHFKTNYKGKMSWTLLSFLNDNILKNRAYEEGCV